MRAATEATENPTRARRLQARLWTGPAAHLVGGALDVGGALWRYGLLRARARLRRPRSRGR